MKNRNVLIKRHRVNLKPHVCEGPMQPGNRSLEPPRARFSGRNGFVTRAVIDVLLRYIPRCSIHVTGSHDPEVLASEGFY